MSTTTKTEETVEIPRIRLTLKSQGLSEVDMRIIEERNAAMKAIADDMSDLEEIMRELSVLVENQREPLIEATENMVHAAEEVQEAVQNLEQAENHTSRSRKWVVGAGVTCAGVVLSGGLLAFISIPVGMVTLGAGLIGGVITIGVATKK